MTFETPKTLASRETMFAVNYLKYRKEKTKIKLKIDRNTSFKIRDMCIMCVCVYPMKPLTCPCAAAAGACVWP